MKKKQKDELGDRMKRLEDSYRILLPRRGYVIIRIDGKAFHSYTKQLKRPFDEGLINDLNAAVQATLPKVQGAQFAYVQSDEISILLTDFERANTDAWFDNNLQKMVSVSASIMTAEFNKRRFIRWFYSVREGEGGTPLLEEIKMAEFDSRAFFVADRIEVYNNFLWRAKDCERNSISSVSYANFPHKQLNGKSSAEKQEMLMTEKNINWSKLDESLKNGRFVKKQQIDERTKWVVEPGWKITKNKKKLWDMIPKIPDDLSLDPS